MPRSTSRGLVSLLALPSRSRWRADDASAVLERLESSGLSVTTFAAREGLSAGRLYRWQARLGRRDPPEVPAFVEVKSTSSTPIEVVLRSGHVIRVRDGFDQGTLARLVAVLEGQPARC